MHAIWFSVIVPALIAAVWVWPMLRAPKVWLAISIFAILVTVTWLGVDAYEFVQSRGSAQDVGLRFIYLLLSETGKPALQLICGSLSAAWLSRRFSESAEPAEFGGSA